MKFRKILALGLAAALAVGSLAACGGSDSGNGGGAADSGSAAGDDGGAAPAASGGTLNVAMATDGTVRSVSDSYSGSWDAMRYGISEALTRVGSDGSIEGWLASDWTTNGDDASEWTFNIRSDVYFSNGTQLTPSLVVDAINYLYDFNDPANGGPDALVSFMIRPTELTADDAAGTVTFKFDTPVMNVAGALSNPAFGIIDWAESEEFEIGTGPYAVDNVTEGHSITLVRNEYYYETVPYDQVDIMAMADSSAEAFALQDGSVDVAFNLSISDLNLLADGGFDTHIASGARDGFFWINLDSTLGNEVLRKAVLTAIDWQTIDEVTVNGSYVYGWTLLAPSYEQYGGASMANPYAYDPAAAEAMLDEAGIVDNDGDGIRELNGENIEINVVTNTSRQMDVLADAMVPMLQEIGIGAVHNLTDDQVGTCTSGAYDLVCWNQVVMQTGDPSNFLYQWDSDNAGANYSRYNNPEYNALYDQLIQTADADEAAGIVQQMQQMLLDDATYMMAGYYNFNSANSSNVTGVVTNGTADYYWITNDIAPAQ